MSFDIKEYCNAKKRHEPKENVPFGSNADMTLSQHNVCSYSESGHAAMLGSDPEWTFSACFERS